MKLYIVHIYPPDTYEGDETFFGVFDSKEKYIKALKNFGKEIYLIGINFSSKLKKVEERKMKRI